MCFQKCSASDSLVSSTSFNSPPSQYISVDKMYKPLPLPIRPGLTITCVKSKSQLENTPSSSKQKTKAVAKKRSEPTRKAAYKTKNVPRKLKTCPKLITPQPEPQPETINSDDSDQPNPILDDANKLLAEANKSIIDLRSMYEVREVIEDEIVMEEKEEEVRLCEEDCIVDEVQHTREGNEDDDDDKEEEGDVDEKDEEGDDERIVEEIQGSQATSNNLLKLFGQMNRSFIDFQKAITTGINQIDSRMKIMEQKIDLLVEASVIGSEDFKWPIKTLDEMDELIEDLKDPKLKLKLVN